MNCAITSAIPFFRSLKDQNTQTFRMLQVLCKNWYLCIYCTSMIDVLENCWSKRACYLWIRFIRVDLIVIVQERYLCQWPCGLFWLLVWSKNSLASHIILHKVPVKESYAWFSKKCSDVHILLPTFYNYWWHCIMFRFLLLYMCLLGLKLEPLF